MIVVTTKNLDESIDFYTGKVGLRLDTIFPADSPRIALLSGLGYTAPA